MKENPFANLPQVEKLLSMPALSAWFSQLSRPYTAAICSRVLEEERKLIGQKGYTFDMEKLLGRLESACRTASMERLQRVVNATGIILHTNMGRSPIPAAAWERAGGVNSGYSNLELNLGTGKRGRRGGIVGRLFCILTGAEAALVVNNNAAALYLILNALTRGKEVIVSRGEQVQIGGGFRIPDILAQSGARLVEVGTTNITTAEDYSKAVTDNTVMALSVHPSNFVVKGFTRKPDLADLARSLPESVILAVDQGSGVTGEQIQGEFSVASALKAGAHLVCFSGDKVFGGPQAGIIVGRADLIDTIGKHPLMRIIRPGKTVYSVLQEYLIAKLNKEAAGFTPGVLSLTEQDLAARGETLLEGLDFAGFSIVPSTILPGGGSSPEKELPSLSIRIDSRVEPDRLLERLRSFSPPIIGTIKENAVLLNLATLLPDDIPAVRSALETISLEETR